MLSGLITSLSQVLSGQTNDGGRSYEQRLEVSLGDESYFVYVNNKLNQTLHKMCGTLANDYHLVENELDQCLPKNPSHTISKANLISHLKMLDERSIIADLQDYIKFNKIMWAVGNNPDAKKLKFKAVSTVKKGFVCGYLLR